jgi:hypothetical protein
MTNTVKSFAYFPFGRHRVHPERFSLKGRLFTKGDDATTPTPRFFATLRMTIPRLFTVHRQLENL